MTDPVARLLPEHDGLQRVVLPDGRRAVAKRRSEAPDGFFAAEARGLQALQEADGLRVPRVLARGESWIVLEDLGEGVAGRHFHARAGRGLARQHARRGICFGFQSDGWCGDSPQDNTPDEDGHRFFAERRLLPQTRRARDGGSLNAHDSARIERLCARLPAMVPAQPPVLLHGDLWRGNLHACADGGPALVDAGAVHCGWAEADLAMLLLFGAPPQELFDSYAEHASLATDWRQRAPVYNLYHLLNHLNLFGGGYLDGVRAVLARYG